MPVTYASEAGAQRRAGALQKLGIYAGIIRQADGRWRLSHDPQDTTLASVLADGGESEDEQS